MMDRDHLHLLINEEIYLINQDEVEGAPEPSAPPMEAVDTVVAEPAKEEESAEPAPVSEKVLPVAIFHESTKESELELLNKIIDACKLDSGSFEVFANGFNKAVKFEKALVFVERAKKFYASVPYKGGEILCARPLSVIIHDQQEKAKLWGALKSYF